eukprot:12396849-Alexandrium_andersonii.AAC.1
MASSRLRRRATLSPRGPSRPGCGSPWRTSSGRACRRATARTRSRARRPRRPPPPSARPRPSGPSASPRSVSATGSSTTRSPPDSGARRVQCRRTCAPASWPPAPGAS